MIMTLLDTHRSLQAEQDKKFNSNEHLADRAERAESGWVSNPALPGLRTAEINISELCNRTCSFCPRSDPDVYANQKLFMSTTTGMEIGKQLSEAEFDGEIHITGFGEPLTHPEIFELLISIAQNWCHHIEITTNGDRLEADQSLINKLFACGISRVTIDSYDGLEQYDRFVHMMRHYPEDRWRIRNHYDDPNKDKNELITEYNFNNRAGNSAEAEALQNKCYLPFYKTMIDWNGDLVLCCNDWQRASGAFGNINETNLSDIWLSEPIVNIRRQLSQGIRKGPACGSCNVGGTAFGEKSFNLHRNNYLQ